MLLPPSYYTFSLTTVENGFKKYAYLTGAYLANLGKMTFNFNKKTGKIENYKSEMLSAKDNAKTVDGDATLNSIVKEAQDKFDQKGKEFLFNNTTTLQGEGKDTRTKETNLGNAIADALAAVKFEQPTDFAVANGGGIRTTLNKDLAITLGDVIKVLPFGNQVTQIKIKGPFWVERKNSVREVYF